MSFGAHKDDSHFIVPLMGVLLSLKPTLAAQQARADFYPAAKMAALRFFGARFCTNFVPPNGWVSKGDRGELSGLVGAVPGALYNRMSDLKHYLQPN